jgi:DNA primase
MPDDRDLVRRRIDLVDLVGERVKLVKIGKKLKGLCPFHAEKTPSFHVDPDLQLFHCFGCKKGGDLFDWVMAIENVDFRQALEMLAERAGVALSSGKGRPKEESDAWIRVMEAALSQFRSALSRAPKVVEYAESRGLDSETVERWELGYSADSEFELATLLKKAGHRLQDAGTMSLLSGDASGYRDFFRNRLMFPIRDDHGRLVAFSGRSIDGTEPKYINSRDTPLFKKSDTLFGLYASRPSLRENRQAVVVEGQMDVIACHKAGLTSAVAALGTALTKDHALRLKRYCDEVVLLYDGDTAGRSATKRAAEIFSGAGLAVMCAMLARGEDPDVILARDGAQALLDRVGAAVSPARYMIRCLIEDFDARPGIVNAEFWAGVRSALATCPDRLEVDSLLDEIAALHPNARVDRQAVVRALRSEVDAMRGPRRRVRAGAAEPNATQAALDPPRPPEQYLIRAAISEEFRAKAWAKLAEDGLVVSQTGRNIADALLAISQEAPAELAREIVLRLDGPMQLAIMAFEQSPLTAVGLQFAADRLAAERVRRQRRENYRNARTPESALENYPSSN